MFQEEDNKAKTEKEVKNAYLVLPQWWNGGCFAGNRGRLGDRGL